ncbi:zinc finger protein 76-like isoform X1 [Biomphalaria glabrata]|uniref:C2H2-type domain-containing protein n=1 Tax=Biomphalaria glabrata TaxID=6526 RepID=A0A2C9JDK5_BIOGL|nr:zinc finger protein 76-like isoform X1 [Biomphalaria glabrata]KAI8784017.1 zinc finger protein 76 isoform X1 [Biomphalaria glabrata]
MDNVLDGLGESNSLSPLSSNVHDHDEDFAGLGDHAGGEIEDSNINSDGNDSLGHSGAEDDDDDHVNIVTSSITGDDDDPIGLGVSGGHEDIHPDVEGLDGAEAEDMATLDENSVLHTEAHLVQASEQDGILITSDADGNLSVPVSADQVIRLLMQASDGNVVTANASMEAIKFTMSNVISSETGEITQTSLTLADGTTLIENVKTEMVTDEEEAQVLPKFEEGQTIKLDDGSTAVLRATPKEILAGGLQAIQLEDGSTAFITRTNPETLFAATSELEERNLNMAIANQTLIIKPVEKAVMLGDKAYKCIYEDCGRLYTTLHHLKVHERSHTGDRPFQCESPNCGKSFATGYGLKSHNRVHTGEKPYPCPHTDKGCEKAFKTSGDLQKHVRTHTGERPFKCPFEGCTQSFTTSNIRKVHIRTHTGERPYICDAEGCNRAFASATNYKNHIRIHTGEKPYVCTFLGCGKRFTEYSSLYKHHVVHTHNKPYTCHCGKTYRQISTLAMHKRTAHGEDSGTILVTSPENDSEEPPSKKRLIKTEIAEEGETNQNLIVSTGEGTQMMLLTPGVNTSEAATFVTADGNQTVASLLTLQAPGSIILQDLQQAGLAGLTGLSLGENGHQVFVVTDPAQLEHIQQLAAQHLESLNQSSETLATLQTTDQSPGLEGQIAENNELAVVSLSQ